MATSLILYNLKKWFHIVDNANEISLNGKTYTARPSSVTIRSGAMVCSTSSSASVPNAVLVTARSGTFSCLAKSGNYYLIDGNYNSKSSSNYYTGIVFASDVISENWGGKLSLLTHVWCKLKSLLRKQVVVC